MQRATEDALDALLHNHANRKAIHERDILAVLTDTEAETWVLWAIGGWTHTELADKFDITVRNVQNRLSGAQRKLREHIRSDALVRKERASGASDS